VHLAGVLFGEAAEVGFQVASEFLFEGMVGDFHRGGEM
jgi:hypothetical protein